MSKNAVVYTVLLICLCAAAYFSLNLFFTERIGRDQLNITSFPYEIGAWKGRDLAITEREYKILETRNLVSREYTSPGGERIYLFVIYSETNRLVFHPPEVCMIGSGINITDKVTENIDCGKSSISVNKLFTDKSGHKELVLYAYKAGNIYTSNFYIQQAYLAFQQIFGRRIPGATIRVSMSSKDGEKATLTALKDFLSKTITIVDSLSAS